MSLSLCSVVDILGLFVSCEPLRMITGPFSTWLELKYSRYSPPSKQACTKGDWVEPDSSLNSHAGSLKRWCWSWFILCILYWTHLAICGHFALNKACVICTYKLHMPGAELFTPRVFQHSMQKKCVFRFLCEACQEDNTTRHSRLQMWEFLTVPLSSIYK